MRRAILFLAAIGLSAAASAQLRLPTIIPRGPPPPALVGIDALRADFVARSGSAIVHFGGDSSVLTPPARATLAAQAQWLRPLSIDLSALARKAVELCTFAGDLLSVPRCIDVRVLWARADRASTVPSSWDELARSDIVFGFPVTTENGEYKIVEGLSIDAFSQECIDKTLAELQGEQDGVKHLL